MTRSEIIGIISIVVTIISIVVACGVGTQQDPPACNINNITVNGGEVSVSCNIQS